MELVTVAVLATAALANGAVAPAPTLLPLQVHFQGSA